VTEINLPAVEPIAPETDDKPFASVAVYCGDNGCDAAREIAGKRHLLDEAPELPLAECAADTCNCRYFRYGDRRSLLSNRRSHGPANDWLLKNNRRIGQERRQLKVDFRRWN
jgi:hypothetical protein